MEEKESPKYDVVIPEPKPITITDEQVDIVRATVARGATDMELKLYFYECKRRGIHPLDRLIHFVVRGTGERRRVAFQYGIDYMRTLAEETGEYRGQEECEYGPMTIVIGQGRHAPEWARATVLRRDSMTGEVFKTSAIAYWEEFYPGEGGEGFMWRNMPRIMLGKVAEAQALRKAFPKRLQGLYEVAELEGPDYDEKTLPKQPQRKSEQAEARHAEPSETPRIKDPDAPSTPEQQKAIHSLARKAGVPDAEIYVEINDILRSVLEDPFMEYVPVGSTKELTKGQASQVIQALNNRLTKQ